MRVPSLSSSVSPALLDPRLANDTPNTRRHTVKHWESHAVSKTHRQALVRVAQLEEKEQRRRAKAKAAAMLAPGPGPAPMPFIETETDASGQMNGKRGSEGHEEEGERSGKRQRVDVEQSGSGVQAVPEANETGASVPAEVDAELDDFLNSIAGVEGDATAASVATSYATNGSAAAPRKIYRPSQPETQTTYEATPLLNAPALPTASTSTSTAASAPGLGRQRALPGGVGPQPAPAPAPAADADADADEQPEETDAQRRAREAQEEKEEILERLEEEQRAQ